MHNYPHTTFSWDLGNYIRIVGEFGGTVVYGKNGGDGQHFDVAPRALNPTSNAAT